MNCLICGKSTERDHKAKYCFFCKKEKEREDHKKRIKKLQKIYFKEFKIIDGLNQHPEGLSFSGWKKSRNK